MIRLLGLALAGNGIGTLLLFHSLRRRIDILGSLALTLQVNAEQSYRMHEKTAQALEGHFTAHRTPRIGQR